MAGYRWARVDLTYFSNPKISELTSYAKLLHLASILYCAEHLTDGHVSRSALKTCADRAGIRRDSRTRRCTELVTAGLWHENGDGWDLHDFETMNPQAMKDEVERDRDLANARKRRSRARRHAVTESHVTDTTRHDTTQLIPITHMTAKVIGPSPAVDISSRRKNA